MCIFCNKNVIRPRASVLILLTNAGLVGAALRVSVSHLRLAASPESDLLHFWLPYQAYPLTHSPRRSRSILRSQSATYIQGSAYTEHYLYSL